jgi:rhodanese-related sulfurtransferase
MPTIPPIEPIANRLVSASFAVATRRDPAGVPVIPPDFVAEQGQLVRIIDVRDADALCGPLGHIPAVTHVPLERIGDVPRVLQASTCIVLVSERGGRAGIAARMLEALGMTRVAAMEGGMVLWKQLGFTTLRDSESYRKTLIALLPGIGRDGKPLLAVPAGAKLTAAQISDHVGEPTSVRWVKLGAFLLHGKRSCVDGRDSAGVIGTPGGDAGELLLALAAIERAEGKQFSTADVEGLLLDTIDTFGRFYMHSDLAALDDIIAAYRKDPRIAPHVVGIDSAADWITFHQRPPEAARDAVLEYLVRPDNMGCGHLRLAMTEDSYHVRRELTRSFLSAFHRLRWSGAPELEWIVLGGAHAEGAVVNITVEGALHSYTRIPLVSPNVGGVQMFVNHPQVTSYLRRELAASLCEAGACSLTDTALMAAIEHLGSLQAAQTLGRLAKGLPVFEIKFDLTGRHTVESRGVILG